MSDQRKNGGPAYPIYTPDMNVGDDAGPGMSLRDWFAGQALVGMLSGSLAAPYEYARDAYEIADAMLKAREAQ